MSALRGKDRDINLYLSASTGTVADMVYQLPPENLNVLTSFFYKDALKKEKDNIPRYRNFMLDSGAFTAMASGKKIDDKYIDSYINYIIEHDIKYFIEMDLDEIIGYEKTLQITRKIEDTTGKKCIPVWHTERGADGWRAMCDQYEYVSLSMSGGHTTTDKWFVAHKYKQLDFFFNVAQKTGTKIHALGCNRLNVFREYPFYSCDNSVFTNGSRYGKILEFKNGKVITHNNDSNYKLNYDAVNKHNIDVMLQVMEYARRCL